MKGLPTTAETRAIAVGPRALALLELAYRARRSVLLEGATGIGKSELLRELANLLGVQIAILDLSLLEPPDLVGLPQIQAGKTSYATPSALPTSGAGILVLEELNRAERYVQQPALQLLTAGRLHEYVLPADWVCFASINPETSDYHVTPLDRALRSRFMHLPLRADRGNWLLWAERSRVHRGVVALVQAHARALDEVPPRTWTYVGELLAAPNATERADLDFLRDVLAGYLPPAWADALLATQDHWGPDLGFNPTSLLSAGAAGNDARRAVARARERGETDRLDELAKRLERTLAGPECGALVASGHMQLEAFEALLGDLPGDHRVRLQRALGQNLLAAALLPLAPAALCQNYANSETQHLLRRWSNEALLRHRAELATTVLCNHLQRQPASAELKRNNALRVSSGHLLTDLPEPQALQLAKCLQALDITPQRPR